VSTAWVAGALPGVWTRTQTSHPDDRGSFTELWRASWLDALPKVGAERMRQANLSNSKPRVLRGMHVHRHQADLWVVAEGRAFVAMVDVRAALHVNLGDVSADVGVATLEAGPGDMLYLPAGVAHGFYAATGLSLVYLVTNEYDGSDEHGFMWNDPAVPISWPDPDPIVSARDAEAPSLAELIAQLKG
jgi:dTDP-4-dehydrorhamnose 3,5-epimerase